jgi:hypothetical protein
MRITLTTRKARTTRWTYGTMMLLTDVAFDMPVIPDLSMEIILTHALHNTAVIQGPTLGITATFFMELGQEGPTAEPAAPVPMEPPDLEPESEFSNGLVESYNNHLATTSIAPGRGLNRLVIRRRHRT